MEPKLTPEERQELRDWLVANEFAETDELIAAVDEGIRSAQSGSSLSIEEAKELISRAAFRKENGDITRLDSPQPSVRRVGR